MNSMKTKIVSCLVFLAFATRVTTLAQGTLVYDQESSNDEVSPFGSVAIQFYGTVGQSFTPSLSTVGFVQLRQFDINPGNSLGATLLVNLRANAINGTILGASTPVVFNDGFVGSVNFFFASAISVVPNTTYFFETVVQSGDTWGATTLGDDYPNGAFYGSGFPFSAADLWFREGIVVPEPSPVSLLLLASGLTACLVRRKR